MSRTTLATRLSAIAAVSAALLIAALAASGAASAGGGNSAAAKLCQKGGWQTLVTSGGTAFASEEACTSYGAAGGAFFPKASAPCLNGGWQAPAQRSDGTAFSSGSDCTTYTSGGGVVYKPTLFLAGEGSGPEDVSIRPLGAAGGRGGTTIVNHFHIGSLYGDGPGIDRLANAVAQRLSYVTGR